MLKNSSQSNKRSRRVRRKDRYRDFFHNNQQTSGMLRLGNGPVLRRKITDIATINYVNGSYKWNGTSDTRYSDITTLDEFENVALNYRMYRIRGVQLIFTKRFALDIPLSGDDSKIASALAFNVYPMYINGAGNSFRYGDSTKIVPVTIFGARTYNIDFVNVLDVTQWKNRDLRSDITIQIAPIKEITTLSQVDIPIFDVVIHYNVEFCQPV